MLIRQSNNTFIRTYGDIGYITNQLNKLDQVYDETGVYFLQEITREPQLVSDVVDRLQKKYIDSNVPKEVIENDFSEFIEILELDDFICTGKSIDELNAKDKVFTYLDNSPKTTALEFIQQNKISTTEKTADFLYEYFQRKPIIFGMHMEVTSRCNEKCIHCYQTRDSKYTLDLSLAKNVMDQLHAMGTVSLTISGGEPFLHPHFMELLEYARSCDFVINILTNGTHINKDMIVDLKRLNINMIQFSLYSMNAEIHDSITQIPGSHEKTMNSISLLLEADIPLQISAPIMKTNKDSYVEISKWCHEKKIRVLSDFIMMAKEDFDKTNLENRLNINETEELISKIINVEEEYKSLLELEPKTWDMEHYKNMPVCGVGIDNACITAEGDLYPCSGFTGYKLGNAKNESLLDIWLKSNKVKQLRKIQNKSFPGCLDCEARDYCAMCLVRNYNENDGNMFTISKHYCQVSFLTKDLVDEYKKEHQKSE